MHAITIPYSKPVISQAEADAVRDQILTGNLTGGSVVSDFESQLASYTQSQHSVVASSGSAALHLACIGAGIDHNATVLTTPLTFVSTLSMAHQMGASSQLIDIDPRFFMPKPEDLAVRLKADPGITHFISVSFAGSAAFHLQYHEICKDHNVIHIADHAHGFGGFHHNDAHTPLPSARYADFSALSFQGTKQLTTGEGGAVLINDMAVAEKLRSIRSLGIIKDNDAFRRPSHGDHYYEAQLAGFNYRMTNLQAVLGIEQLSRFEDRHKERVKLAKFYLETLANTDAIRLPTIDLDHDALHLFPIQINDRSSILKQLRDKGYGVQVHYVPLYYHPVFEEKSWYEQPLTNTEAFYSRAVSIPFYPGLSLDQAKQFCETLISLIK